MNIITSTICKTQTKSNDKPSINYLCVKIVDLINLRLSVSVYLSVWNSRQREESSVQKIGRQRGEPNHRFKTITLFHFSHNFSISNESNNISQSYFNQMLIIIYFHPFHLLHYIKQDQYFSMLKSIILFSIKDINVIICYPSFP